MEEMQKDEGLSLLDIVRVLLHKIKLLILVVIIGAASGAFIGWWRYANVKNYGTSIEFYVNPEKPKEVGSSSNNAANAVGSQYGVYGAYGRHVMDAIVKLLESESFAEQLMLNGQKLPCVDVNKAETPDDYYPNLNEQKYLNASNAIAGMDELWKKIGEEYDAPRASALNALEDEWERAGQVGSFTISACEKLLSSDRNGEYNDLKEAYDSPKFPLFLLAEIALMNLDSLFIYEPQVSAKNKEKAKELRKLVEELRTKLVTLKHSEIFDSNKHISPEAWKGIASCRGSFTQAVEEKEGLKHFVIRYTITSDDGVWRNGDYYYDNVYTSHYNHILYQEDIEEIYKRKLQREKQESDEYYAHFTKYFKNGVIPAKYKGFEEYLIDPTIDERIIKELGTFVLMYNSPEHQRSHTDFAHSKHASFYLEDLQRAERLVKKEKEENQRKREEKDSAIEGARKRYQQKSFFWKMLNRKLNPERLDFESMETEEIKELYTGGKKTK
jgi:hypothetical protein